MSFKSQKEKYILNHRPLGEGGQAKVFMARDRVTGEIVALKRVPPRDSDAIARMRREIEVQTKIKHPNIMPVLDHSQNYHWYTMPLANKILGKLEPPLMMN